MSFDWFVFWMAFWFVWLPSSIWVYADGKRRDWGSDDPANDALSWAVMTFLIWAIAFPLYVAKRHDLPRLPVPDPSPTPTARHAAGSSSGGSTAMAPHAPPGAARYMAQDLLERRTPRSDAEQQLAMHFPGVDVAPLLDEAARNLGLDWT